MRSPRNGNQYYIIMEIFLKSKNGGFMMWSDALDFYFRYDSWDRSYLQVCKQETNQCKVYKFIHLA